jgi:hypothetical protein
VTLRQSDGYSKLGARFTTNADQAWDEAPTLGTGAAGASAIITACSSINEETWREIVKTDRQPLFCRGAFPLSLDLTIVIELRPGRSCWAESCL